MKKFKVKIAVLKTEEIEVEDINLYSSNDEIIELIKADSRYKSLVNEEIQIKEYRYISDDHLTIKEFYCCWWNTYDWKSKVVLAHSREDVHLNISKCLDSCVYNLAVTENNANAISKLHQDLTD